MNVVIGLILRSLASAASLELFGGKTAALAPILNTIASLSELPEATRPAAEALLAQVRGWVEEKRAPTLEELEEFEVRRNALDDELRALRAGLETPNGGL